ncbi:hypothetical protein [Xanthomonas graminis]|uniref:Uncharacterized protein n=1 Tax=Xanthomonas graminis pv. poae TaxID=227946 RepID=A0A199P146_9XANT|nr:hypothetical protein [Xanthomonas translucens]OAX54755.1 hypothetical protein A6R73_00250 [Xanthomonas translucens pv. poae]
MRALRCEFDLLLQGLSAALLDAQQRCRARHQQVLRACFGGEATLPLAVATDDAPSLQIPLWELRAWQTPQIGHLTLAFGVELDVLHMPDEAPRLLLQVLPRKPRRPGHRLQIVFEGTHAPLGEVLFDGQRLKLWNLQRPPGAQQPPTEPDHA